MISLISFLVVIAICIISHEYGHYKTAKLAGVQVHEFAFGMGPVIWQKTAKDGTQWSFRIFPVGGFVRLAGMDEEKPGEEVVKGGAFTEKSAIQRFLILFNGALANIILAILLTAIFLYGHGILDLDNTRIGELMQGFPAQEAGIETSDVVKEVNGTIVDDWDGMSKAIKESAENGPVSLLIDRNGNLKTFSVEIPISEEYGVPLLGIRPAYRSFSLAGSVFHSFSYIFRMSAEWVQGIYMLLTNQSDADITGPVGIASLAGRAARAGLWSFISFLAIINLNLGLINLFPFPGLDGGRLVFIFIELITRKRVPDRVENFIHLAGFIILIALILFVTWKDIIRLF